MHVSYDFIKSILSDHDSILNHHSLQPVVFVIIQGFLIHQTATNCCFLASPVIPSVIYLIAMFVFIVDLHRNKLLMLNVYETGMQ